jgi:hypothetical protein
MIEGRPLGDDQPTLARASPAGPEPRFAPGTLLAGRYRVIYPLGRGGMGEVYRADDLKLGQAVALKFVRSDLPANAKQRLSALGVLSGQIDPAFERVIAQCLEEDPQARPASARALLALLPGGDALEAAIAAGETPAPDVVAAAGTVGGLRPAVAWGALLTLLGSLALVVWVSDRRSTIPRKPPPSLKALPGPWRTH